MARTMIKNEVPELWRRRQKARLCPVCGKPREEFEKGRKVFCTQKCVDEYSSKYTYWSQVKEKILERDGCICAKCGNSRDLKHEKNMKRQKEILKEWIKTHQKELKTERDRLLVQYDRIWKEQYDEIMDDFHVAKRYISWDEQRKLFKGCNDDYIEIEVDHITPVALGGSMWDENNMQVLCRECHKKKTKEDMKKIKEAKKDG